MVFLNFINSEMNRINEILGKNENVNVLNSIKKTKFGISKYNYKYNDTNNNNVNQINKIAYEEK